MAPRWARMRATTAAARFPMSDIPERDTPARASAAGGRSASATVLMPSDAASSIAATEPILCMSPPSSTAIAAGLRLRDLSDGEPTPASTFRSARAQRFRAPQR